MYGIQQYPCTICGNVGHKASKCKEIAIPPDGFYKPVSGQHNCDEDNDNVLYYNKWCEADDMFIVQIYNLYDDWLHRIQTNKSRKISLP